jgi:3-hydroxybutyryl-CoA dehydrogenase
MPAEIHTVCFVGAGNMGCFNAVKAACAGYRVTLYDRDHPALCRAQDLCAGYFDYFSSIGFCPSDAASEQLSRIVFTSDLSLATQDADLVSESVFEDLTLKREIHERLDRLCPAHTILTTNSSFLLGSHVDVGVSRGDRFAAMHSYMGSPLVDLVGTGRTSHETLATLERYIRSLNATPLVLKKEYPGYVLNAILGPFLGMAMTFVAQGVATASQVDRAWMTFRSAPMGPMGIMDIIGLSLIRSGWKNRGKGATDSALVERVLAVLDPMIAANHTGISAGKGFYDYPNPLFERPDFLLEEDPIEALYNPLMTIWIANALKVAAAEVLEPSDIDKAWMIGTSLDQGPFAVLADVGAYRFETLLEELVGARGFDPKEAQMVTDYARNRL